MKNKNLAIAITAILVSGVAVAFLWHSGAFAPAPPPKFDHLAHPARKISFWKEVLSRPLERRLIEAPPMLIDYVNKDNVVQGWPDGTRSTSYTPEFKAELVQALTTLPEPVLKRLESSLAFITVVKDLGGSGYTDSLVTDSRGFTPYSFVVLDVDSLNRKANEWMTWKESSPFKVDENSRIEGVIEESTSDDRIHAIQYLLLHEIGHVVSYSLEDFPRFSDSESDFDGKLRIGFPAVSWQRTGERVESRLEAQFQWIGGIPYYATPEKKLSFDVAVMAYTDLPRTDFATLYATTNFQDDFADSLASYVHTELQGKPWEIRVTSPGREPIVYRTCWKEERCKKKRLILESILGIERGI